MISQKIKTKVVSIAKLKKRTLLTFSYYQNLTKLTDVYTEHIEKEYKNKTTRELLKLHYVLCGLCSEVGELQGKIKKSIRGDYDYNKDLVEELSKEIGDVLWYLSQLCTELGLKLDIVAKQNIDKLFKRKNKGTLKGKGDNR